MPGIVSRLAAALTYPRALDDYLELASPFLVSREIRARITDVRRETADVATLVLDRHLPHKAGQHVLLGVEIDGVRRTRCFSIASAEGEPVELTVKARPSGRVTPRLVAGELRGAIVTLSPPSGDFVLPDPLPRRILLVSGGSGITPVMAMLRTLQRRAHSATVTFVHFARTEADVIFAEELAGAAHPWLRVHVGIGPFDPAALPADAPTWDTWACGPPPFLDAVRARCPDARIERFGLAEAPAGEEASVTFARAGVRARGRGPLLLTAEKAGLTPESGCRRGICGTCKCRKLAGTTLDLRTGELSTDADVDVALCVSEPVGPVTLDL